MTDRPLYATRDSIDTRNVTDALAVATLVRQAKSLGYRSAMGITNLGFGTARRGFVPSPEVLGLLHELEAEARSQAPATLPAVHDTDDAQLAERRRIANRLFSYERKDY